MQQLKLKEKLWYNFGDVNHREHGGMFVRKWDNEIEVVRIVMLDEPVLVTVERNFCKNYQVERNQYVLSSRSDYVKDLLQDWNAFKRGQQNAVGRFADWKQLLDNKTEGLELLFRLAIDHMSYYGGSNEDMIGTNYWDLLGPEGIGRNNIH
jgi:hypothetical protein